MKRILLSLLALSLAGAGLFYGSQAYFSDVEESTGNTFTAGAIDLTIDSQAHYANMTCIDGKWVVDQGKESTRPDLVGDDCYGSWIAKDLDGEKFFDYSDLKPGDNGENTISMKVNSNDAYMCAYIENMVDSENGQTEPEKEVDQTTDVGELSDELRFFAWADDGDNVYEPGNQETALFSNVEGPASDVLDGKVYAMYTPQTGAFPGGATKYIGVYWCYGEITVDGGLTCNGAPVSNATQTDGLTADIRFYVEQARNNPNFVCPPLPPKVSVGAVEMTGSAGERFRSFSNTGGNELYAGISDLGIGGNRVELGYTWASPGTYPVGLTYDKDNNKLIAKLNDQTLEYPNFSTQLSTLGGGVCTVNNLNAMQIAVVARHTDTEVDLNNVDLDGYSLGNFSAVYNSWNTWNVTGYDFSNGFEMTGDLSLTGAFTGTSQELSKVEILVGCK